MIESVWAEARDLIRRLEGSTVQRFAVAAGEYKIEIERGAPSLPIAASGDPGAALPSGQPVATGAGPGLGVAPGARMASGVFTLEPSVDNRIPVLAPLVGTFYAGAKARREGVRRGRRHGRLGADGVHRRGDEDDERGGGPECWQGRRDRRRGWRVGRIRAGADVPGASRGWRPRVREGSDRQPRRDRAAGRPRLPRAGDQIGGGLLDRRRAVGGGALCRRGGAHWPAASRQELSPHPEPDRGGPEDRRRCDPSRLRFPLRGPLLRRDLLQQRHHVHRPAA